MVKALRVTLQSGLTVSATQVGCRRNTLVYNSLLSGYAKKGYAVDALRLFEQMKAENIPPDERYAPSPQSQAAMQSNMAPVFFSN